MNNNMIKIIGIAATVLGVCAQLVSGWVDDKKMDEKINNAVDEALTKRENEKSEEEEKDL